MLSSDSQESAPAPQFESINSLALSFLYGPTLMFVQYYWKNHSFHHTNLCWQTDVSAFQYVVSVCHSFPSEEQASFNFMVVVTICSDFGAQENKICYCFHFSPIYLPLSDWTRSHDLSFLNAEFQASLFTLLCHLHQEAL